MRSIRIFALAVLAILFVFGTASASFRSGEPILLKLEDVGDLNYAFDGSPLEIPFTLSGTGATVVLAIYPGDAIYDTPLTERADFDPEAPWYGFDVVYVSEGEWFEEGSHVITWDGKDLDGNLVPAGDYSYFLYAIDELGQPTIAAAGRNSGTFVEELTAEGLFLWVGNGDPVVKAKVGIDWYANPDAYESWDVVDLLSPDRPWGVPNRNPNEPDVIYLYCPDTGLYKIKLNEDGTAELVTDWADGGVYHANPGGKMRGHRFELWDGKLYVPYYTFGPEPNENYILVLDPDTGELLETIDVYDVYSYADVDGVTHSHGPNSVSIDETGIVVSSHHSGNGNVFAGPLSGATFAKVTFDGQIIWMNHNGDFFGDQYENQDPVYVWIYDADIDKYGNSYMNEYGSPATGFIAGPDGKGIYKFSVVEDAESQNSSCVKLVDEDSDYDGLYYSTSDPELGNVVAHIPFDVMKARIMPGTGVEVVEANALPTSYRLGDSYPNPFNPRVFIDFELPESGEVVIEVYNSQGQLVRTLVDEKLSAGSYRVDWDGRDERGARVSSGMYVYKMRSGTFSDSKKMTLMK